MFKLHDEIYSNSEFLKIMQSTQVDCQTTRGKVKYCNIPASFDIETSSFMYGEEKCAIMYIWQFCVNGYVTVGRTWEEFINLLDELSKILGLNADYKHLVIYVHNLSFEFQFMRKWLEWYKVFSLKKRQPLKAVTFNGFEFRCSYLLSGYSLAKVGEELTRYKVNKKVGQLDYKLIRTPITPLTKEELEYCVYDVLVVVAYIQEKIENEGGIIKIPLTKTGYVRNYCREKCLYIPSKTHQRRKNFTDLIKVLTLEPQEYYYLHQAFQGGFTHANYDYVPRQSTQVDRIESDVESRDFTSSYPAVMLSEKFPMSKGKKVYIQNEEQFRRFIKKYCCVFSITMYGVNQKENVHENPISASRCIKSKNFENGKVELSYGISENNGRVYSAEKITMIITEVDFEIYEAFYDIEEIDWESIVMYYYIPGYLPKPLIECVLDFYEKKTTLKDIAGKDVEYMLFKGMLNSIYGMMVTDICRDEIVYNDEWKDSIKADINKEIDSYNKSKKRFLFYPWGIYITAYARRNLFSGILALGEDYIYSDTDSVKFLNSEKHQDYFERYNKLVTQKINNCLSYYGLDISRSRPKTVKGEEKPLGVWDFDGRYKRFKTLGAKRYLVEYDKPKKKYDENGGVHEVKYMITIAGLSKQDGLNYMLKLGDPFKVFNNELNIPAEETGKSTHTYLDWEDGYCEGIVVDYLSRPYHFLERSAIHLEACPFSLSLSDKFAEFLLGIEEGVL